MFYFSSLYFQVLLPFATFTYPAMTTPPPPLLLQKTLSQEMPLFECLPCLDTIGIPYLQALFVTYILIFLFYF